MYNKQEIITVHPLLYICHMGESARDMVFTLNRQGVNFLYEKAIAPKVFRPYTFYLSLTLKDKRVAKVYLMKIEQDQWLITHIQFKGCYFKQIVKEPIGKMYLKYEREK